MAKKEPILTGNAEKIVSLIREYGENLVQEAIHLGQDDQKALMDFFLAFAAEMGARKESFSADPASIAFRVCDICQAIIRMVRGKKNREKRIVQRFQV